VSTVCDNASEFTPKPIYFWATKVGVTLDFVKPAKPTQNAFVESFNAKMRE
jgi:putative transposase